MTPDTTTDEQALRIAIAEKLGWKWWKFTSEMPETPTLQWCTIVPGDKDWPKHLNGVLVEIPDTTARITDELLRWTTDANDALLLVEHMRKEGWKSSHFDYEDGSWVWLFFHTAYGTKKAAAPTFPLAVAKAFAGANNLTPQP